MHCEENNSCPGIFYWSSSQNPLHRLYYLFTATTDSKESTASLTATLTFTLSFWQTHAFAHTNNTRVEVHYHMLFRCQARDCGMWLAGVFLRAWLAGHTCQKHYIGYVLMLSDSWTAVAESVCVCACVCSVTVWMSHCNAPASLSLEDPLESDWWF